jgi:Zn-dependent protease with chaperone function
VDPGERLDLAHHPLLRQLLDRVAERIGTRPVDDVFLTPGTEIAVMERGGVQRQLTGGARRCLILGIGVLDGMTVGQLKAILAHEYGHFSNRDTAGGGVALSVRRSIVTMTIHLVQGGAAAWYNPAWWFVRGFYALFLRISQGASRLQEILADRWAAFAYGSAAFAAGLTHVIEASVRFDVNANAAVREALDKARPLPNLYTYRSPDVSDAAHIQQQIDEAMRAEPSPYDSHPAPAQRLAWVGALDAPGEPDARDGDDAWTLLNDREALEKHMTAQVRESVTAEHGIQFKEATDSGKMEPGPAEEGS